MITENASLGEIQMLPDWSSFEKDPGKAGFEEKR
jgi:hypothetical protein